MTHQHSGLHRRSTLHSQNSGSNGSENEPQQHHKAPEEERAAAPHSKGGAYGEASQKLARVRYAKAALRRELCSWRRVMITDSKHSQQASKYINPNNKLPHKGVAKDEYTHVLRDHFISEGNKVFAHAGKWADNWKLQQDNA
ncbi:TPA: hypothetical protein ACH3X2_001355 [Trebouxia sp. C0005]